MWNSRRPDSLPSIRTKHRMQLLPPMQMATTSHRLRMRGNETTQELVAYRPWSDYDWTIVIVYVIVVLGVTAWKRLPSPNLKPHAWRCWSACARRATRFLSRASDSPSPESVLQKLQNACHASEEVQEPWSFLEISSVLSAMNRIGRPHRIRRPTKLRSPNEAPAGYAHLDLE